MLAHLDLRGQVKGYIDLGPFLTIVQYKNMPNTVFSWPNTVFLAILTVYVLYLFYNTDSDKYFPWVAQTICNK